MGKIPVIEIFGPTIQGEGMVIGRKTMFVRTAGCDYRCIWCDSAFTWDGSGKEFIRMMTAKEIWQELKDIGGERFSFVTLSGGNPALLPDLSELITLLKANNIKIGLETQGSRWQDWFLDIDELTLSPKPPSSKMVTDFEKLDEIIEKLSASGSSFSLKIVVFNDEDYEYARNIHKNYPEVPFFLQAGNEEFLAVDHKTLLAKLLKKYEWLICKVTTDSCLNNVRVLPQLHTYLWGNKRGV